MQSLVADFYWNTSITIVYIIYVGREKVNLKDEVNFL